MDSVIGVGYQALLYWGILGRKRNKCISNLNFNKSILTVIEIIVIILAISFALFVMIGHLKTIYRRHLKTYRPDIKEFLENQNLTFQAEYYPNKIDWNNSPFEKPKRFRFRLLIITINGLPISWNDQRYKVIQTVEGKTIWLEIDTTYFKSPELTFKFSRTNQKKNKRSTRNDNVVKVQGKCPACGFKLAENDSECPDCGLNFG